MRLLYYRPLSFHNSRVIEDEADYIGCVNVDSTPLSCLSLSFVLCFLPCFFFCLFLINLSFLPSSLSLISQPTIRIMLMARACYNPQKAVTFFDKMDRLYDSKGQYEEEHFPAHLRTHSEHKTRRKNLQVKSFALFVEFFLLLGLLTESNGRSEKPALFLCESVSCSSCYRRKPVHLYIE